MAPVPVQPLYPAVRAGSEAPGPDATLADVNNTEIQGRVDELLALGDVPIVQVGHPVLRRTADRYDGQLNEAALKGLLLLMRRVMHAAPGVGLAAPQIGIPLQLAVLEDQFSVAAPVAEARSREPLDYLEVLNPRYEADGTESAAFFEGCLSFPGYQAVVDRPFRVRAAYETPDGNAVRAGFSGWQARIFQHETDHLAGTIYLDKAYPRSLCSNAEYALHWSQPTVERARAALRF